MARIQISNELHREVVYPQPNIGLHCSCNWCGGLNAHGNLFKYSVIKQDDLSGRVNYIKGVFCSIDCMRTHNS